MLGATPTKFRSRYTGREIDQLLASIGDKIDISYIVNHFDGGTKVAASAELAKILYQRQAKFDDPNYIKALFLTIPSASVFTDQDRAKLDRLAGFFLGSYLTVSARNTAVPTLGFKGGEITFLVDDGNGIQELSYWDTVSVSWKKATFVKPTVGPIIPYSTAGVVAGLTVDNTQINNGKYAIKMRTADRFVFFELTVVTFLGNTYWTVSNLIGDPTTGGIENVSISGSNMNINFRLYYPNSFVRIARIAEF